jgi:ribosomal protein S18 acetylase RimI-like enzyme
MVVFIFFQPAIEFLLQFFQQAPTMAAHPSVEPFLRPFQPADRDALFKIAADTAYFGDPIEAYLEDRRIFLDAFYAYYTDLEPEHIWVAEAGGELAGFLTGCIDTKRQQLQTHEIIRPRVWRKFLRGAYRIGPKGLRYLLELFLAGLRREGTKVDLQRYPAHLHINVAAAWRGKGLGRRLMLAYLDQLREIGAPGVHLQTTSRNEAACRMYESLGFRLVDARLSRMWRWKFPEPLEERAYAREL